MSQYAVLVDGTTTTNLAGAQLHRTKPTEVLTAARTLTEADSGTLFIIDLAAGFAITLPALGTLDTDVAYEFYVLTTLTGNLTITAQAADLLAGKVENIDTDSTNAHTFYAPDGTDDLIITLNGTTTGGIAGSSLRLVAYSPTRWLVQGQVFASGTPATLFS